MKKFACILVVYFMLSSISWAGELENIIAAAQKGDAEAQTELGYMYYYGDGAPRNYDKALEWYNKAAAQNYVYAQYNLGLIYDRGEGVMPDAVTAFSWYKKAAANGWAQAQHNVAHMYQTGVSVKSL